MTALRPVSFRKGRRFEKRLSAPYVPGKRHARFWTDSEIALVTKHYPTKGGLFCQAKMPHRSERAVYQLAKKLELKCQRQSPHRRRWKATPEVDDAIRSAWPELKGRGAVEGLAGKLGLPRWWVSKRALKMGLTAPHKKEPPWTDAETALIRKVPLHDPVAASRIFREHGFRRTPTAIVVRAKRLDLSRRYLETFSGRAIAKLLGVDNKTVVEWLAKGWMPAGRRKTKRLPQQGGDPWSVTRDDLKRFVVDNLERIDFRKVDKFALVDLLTNASPAASDGGSSVRTRTANEGRPKETSRKVPGS